MQAFRHCERSFDAITCSWAQAASERGKSAPDTAVVSSDLSADIAHSPVSTRVHDSSVNGGSDPDIPAATADATRHLARGR
jgi:hypothetical protein